MRIVRTSYKAAIGNMTITVFRVIGVRVRRKVPVLATSKK